MQMERVERAGAGPFRLGRAQIVYDCRGVLFKASLDSSSCCAMIHHSPSLVPVICLVAAFHIVPQGFGGDGVEGRS
jgi:hypothetical protein